MNPTYRGVGPVEARLAEELAEVIQVICKAQRWGWGGVNPEDGKTKRARVVEEMRDAVDVWNELAMAQGLPILALIDGVER